MIQVGGVLNSGVVINTMTVGVESSEDAGQLYDKILFFFLLAK